MKFKLPTSVRQFAPKKVECTAKPYQIDQEKSLWNLWRDGVTASFLSNWVEDREQCRIQYIDGLSSRNVPIYFEYGSCCHWILEQIYGAKNTFGQELTSLSKDQRLEFCTLCVKEWVDRYSAKWLSEVPRPTQKQLDQQELVYGFAEVVMPSYFLRWDGDFTGHYSHPNKTTTPAEWRSLEEEFNFPYVFPDGRSCPIRGKRDGTFYDKARRIYVFDTKCRSVHNDETSTETLPKDIQQMLYLWITHEELRNLRDTSTWPSGTIMNVIRRPGHRRGENEALPHFLERIRKDVISIKKYDHNYIRNQMLMTPMEVMTWKKTQLDPIMQGVRMWWEGTFPHFLNPSVLTTKFGKNRFYAEMLGQTSAAYYKRTKVFSELS